jgi:hypothetical protein
MIVFSLVDFWRFEWLSYRSLQATLQPVTYSGMWLLIIVSVFIGAFPRSKHFSFIGGCFRFVFHSININIINITIINITNWFHGA